jgi:hypothetical protein
MTHVLASCLCLILALTCSAATPSENQPDDSPAGTITVTGALTAEGVECQAMRGDDGKLYTLAGNLEGFRNGDRVRVTGRVAEVSICMQGTTIAVSRIEKT